MQPDPPDGMIAELVAERIRQGHSQAWLADELGVTQTAISYWENAQREITLLAAKAYAEALGMRLALVAIQPQGTVEASSVHAAGPTDAEPTGPSTEPLRGAEGHQTTNDGDLLEQLAAIEHERWSHWQSWMHEQCYRKTGGSLIIPADLVTRWERQAQTAYADLTEPEKQSDRDQVMRYWHLITNRYPHYTSTYCIHDLHDECRLTCKTCVRHCLCACHKDGEQ